MDHLIFLDNVYKIYGEGLGSEVRALNGVDLSIDRGEFVAIVGSSGSGKTTMMNILGCLDIPTYGDYVLNGELVSELEDTELSRIRNREIGFIFQGFNLIPELTAIENVELPILYSGIKGSRRELAMDALRRVGLEDRQGTGLRKCPEVSNRGWRLPVHLQQNRQLFWRMSPPETSTQRTVSR